MNQPASAPASPMQLPATWDAIAAGYAQELSQFTEFAEEALRIAGVHSEARVLDVGTGPGALALHAAPRVARVTAVDFAPAMIEELRQRARREGIGNVDALVMDAQALALPDGAFDAAFSLFVFMFVPDRSRAFRELHRVLRPGGRAVVATWGPIENRPLMKIGFDALAEALPDLPRPQKGDLQQPDECVAEMSAAGLRDVQCRPFTVEMQVGSPDGYLEMLVRTGAMFPALRKRLGEEAWQAALERMRQSIARRIPASGMRLAAQAMMTSGTR